MASWYVMFNVNTSIASSKGTINDNSDEDERSPLSHRPVILCLALPGSTVIFNHASCSDRDRIG